MLSTVDQSSSQEIIWYDRMDFDLWATFTYKGHIFTLDRLAQAVMKEGRNLQLTKPVMNDKAEPSRLLEEAKKALYNHLKQFALDTRTHLLAWSGGEYQPINQLPHYHTAIKLSRPIPQDKIQKLLVDKWNDRNPSSIDNPSAEAVPFISGIDGIGYIEKHKDKWIDAFCPKRAVRCKNNKCKGVSAFRL